MKKSILILAVSAFGFILPAEAQIKFGIRGGLNLNKVSWESSALMDNFDGKNRCGFFVGPTVEFTIPVAGLGVEGAILYDNRVTVLPTVSESTKTMQYILVPIDIKYTLGLSSKVSIYGATGPQFAYNIGDRDWKIDPNDLKAGFNDWKGDWELKKSEFSWNFGAGVKFLGHFQVGYTYNIRLGNTKDFSIKDTANSIKEGKLKDNTHKLSLTYYF